MTDQRQAADFKLPFRVLQAGLSAIAVIMATAACHVASAQDQPAGQPENLAPLATITASSVHNEQYLGKLVADGAIPNAMSHADIGRAWCARGNSHPQGVTLTFRWPEPVQGRRTGVLRPNGLGVGRELEGLRGLRGCGGEACGRGTTPAGTRPSADRPARTDHGVLADAEVPEFLRRFESWRIGNPGLRRSVARYCLCRFHPADSRGGSCPATDRGIQSARECCIGPATGRRRAGIHEADCRAAAAVRSHARLHVPRGRSETGWRSVCGRPGEWRSLV